MLDFDVRYKFNWTFVTSFKLVNYAAKMGHDKDQLGTTEWNLGEIRIAKFLR